MTGYRPDDDRVVVLHGEGENGKSTLLAGIRVAVGEHAAVI